MIAHTWQAAYETLKDFIARNPSIEIDPGVFSIPQDMRSNFYRLFDVLREDFVKDTIPDFLGKTRALSSKHEEARNGLSAILGLTEIEIETGLNDFIRNPVGIMIGLITDLVFDLLMGKSSPSTFEEIASSKIEQAFDAYFRQGYKSWLTLSLLQHLAPDNAYVIPLSNDVSAPYDYDIGNAGAQDKQMVPDAEPANRLSFNRTQYHVLLVPKVIVHSKQLDIFVSLLQEFRFVPTEARYHNQQIEWYKIPDITEKLGQSKIWPDIMVYLARQPKDLLLVADMFSVARPDIIVNILHKSDMSKSDKLATFKSQNEVLAPRIGSFIISSEAIPDEEIGALTTHVQTEQQSETTDVKGLAGSAQSPESSPASTTPNESRSKVRMLGVVFEAAKLGTIIDTIKNSRVYTDLRSNLDAIS